MLGLAFGSFINALAYRLENNILLKGRSFCPKCKKKILWYDNIPIFSWLLLKGKCRQCRKEISIQYPIVETLTGLGFLITVYAFGYLEKSIFSFSVVDALLIVLVLYASFVLIFNAIYDFKTGYLYSNLMYSGIVSILLFLIISQRTNLEAYLPYLISAIVPAIFFFSLSYFSKGAWMGEGDWELVLLIGLLLGFPKIIIGLYFAFIVGAIYGLISIYLKRLKMKSAVPFGPFLVAGCFFSLLFGEYLLQFYVKIFLGG